jgi:hypothetical protein
VRWHYSRISTWCQHSSAKRSQLSHFHHSHAALSRRLRPKPGLRTRAWGRSNGSSGTEMPLSDARSPSSDDPVFLSRLLARFRRRFGPLIDRATNLKAAAREI